LSSTYPGALDNLATNKADATDTPTDHPAHHNDLADAVNKVEAELGTDPSGASATVKARLDGVDTTVAGKAAASHTHATSDVTGLDTALASEATARAAADSALSAAVAGKANVSHSHAISDVSNLQATLDGKADDGDVTAEATARAAGDALAIPLTQKAVASGVASLDSGGHVPEVQAPPRSGLAMLDVLGHSYTINGAGSNVGPGAGYVDRLAYSLGARRRNNRGWGGSISCWPQVGAAGDGGYAWALQEKQAPGAAQIGSAPITKPGHPDSPAAPYLARAQVALHHQTLNDLAQLGSTNPRPMKEAHRAIWSRLCAAAICEDTHAAWAFTGTWSTIASTTRNSGTGYHRSTTLNDKATFTVLSDVPAGMTHALLLPLDADHDLTVGVKVNGVSQADARLQGSALCDQASAARHNVAALRFRASGASNSPLDYIVSLSAGDTIELTLKTQTVAGSALNVDCAHVEADPLDGPVLVVPRPNRCPNYTGWAAFPHGPAAGSDPMNDAAVATWDTALQSVASEFPGRTVAVDIDTALANDSLNFQNEAGAIYHPNAKGMGLVAAAIRSAILASGYLTERVLTRSIPDVSPFFEPIGTVGRVVFANSWTNFGFEPTGFHKHLDGTVETRGGVKSGSSATAAIFTYPVGHRPGLAQYRLVNATAATVARAQIASTGVLNFDNGGNTTYTGLDNIRFSAEM
jgi:hypothetical protein